MSNNVSYKAKKKRAFNIVDFLILLAVVALVAILIYAFSPWSQIKKLLSQDQVTVDYTVEIRNVDQNFIELIKKGDSVKNSVTKSSLGTVTGLGTVKNSAVLDVDENGEGVFKEYPDKYDITVYITVNADYQSNVGYSANGCRIAVGEELFLCFPQFNCSGYCVAFDTKS